MIIINTIADLDQWIKRKIGEYVESPIGISYPIVKTEKDGERLFLLSIRITVMEESKKQMISRNIAYSESKAELEKEKRKIEKVFAEIYFKKKKE